MQLATIETPTLAIGCELSGPEDGRPVVLLHGWPDDVRTWDRILPALHGARFKTVVPYLEALVKPGSDPLKPHAPDSYRLWDKIYLTWLTCLSSNTLRWSAMTGERAQPTSRVVLLRNESLIALRSP